MGAGISRRRGLLAGLGALAAALAGASAEAAPDAQCKPNRMECRGAGECCSGHCRNGWCAPKNGRGHGKGGGNGKDKDKDKGDGGNGKGGGKPKPKCDVACSSGDSAACGAALNLALANGGTVRVCPGEYAGPFPLTADVEIIGSGSGNNPKTNTILLGAAGQGSVVPVTAAVTARLASLRVTGGNGAGSNSGGVYVSNATADVTIDRCALVGNAGSYGGGVSVYSGTLTITGSEISGNTATNGGGVATATLSTIESTSITGNTATTNGGGVFVNSGTSTLGSGVTITGNTAGSGGGIYKHTAGAIINNSATVANNTPDNCAGNGFTCS